MLTFVNKQQTYLLRTLGWLFGPWNSTDYRSSFEMHKKPVEKVIPSIFERLGQFLFFKQRIGVETMWKVNTLEFLLLCFIYP